MVAEGVLKEGSDKTHIIFNRFQSVISFKPTVATILSPAAFDRMAEEAGGNNLFDTYEVEGPDRGELLLDLGEFQVPFPPAHSSSAGSEHTQARHVPCGLVPSALLCVRAGSRRGSRSARGCGKSAGWPRL